MNSKMLVSTIIDFMAHYGPSHDHIPTPAVVCSCKDFLLQHGVLSRRVAHGEEIWSWTKFPEPPSQTNKPEKEVYEPFADVVEKIWEYAGDSRNHQYCFEMVDSDKTRGSSRGVNHNINAHIIEETYQETLSNSEIILPVKFNTTVTWSEDEQSEIREQIIGDCKRITRDDPRRKFIYGMTIEDDRLSLWYVSRSYIVKALAFKFMSGEGIDRFINIMLCFAYATTSDLGIDPRVHKAVHESASDEQRWIYEFDVENDFTTGRPDTIGPSSSSTQKDGCDCDQVLHDDRKSMCNEANGEEDGKDDLKNVTHPLRSVQAVPTSLSADGKRSIFFRTMRLICLGSRSRIWEVVEVVSLHDLRPVSGARPVILKDIWVDAKSNTEGQNMDLVFEAIDQFVADGLKANPGPDGMTRFLNKEPRFKDFNDRTKERLAKLLTGNKYRELFLTKLLEWNGELSKPAIAYRLKEPLVNTAGNPNWSNYHDEPRISTQLGTAVEVTWQYGQKKQVRIIYKEVCKQISSLRTYGEAMDVARQALDALQILYCAGWIHRDISVGNILAFPIRRGGTITWQVKLADFEFSQLAGYTRQESEPIIGTPQFISVEVDTPGNYLASSFVGDGARRAKAYALKGLPPPEPREPNLATGRFNLNKSHSDYNHYAQFISQTPGFYDYKELPPVIVSGPIPRNLVSQNYQHDLESLWWIMLYLVTALSGDADLTGYYAYANTVFTRAPNSATRRSVLTHQLDGAKFPMSLILVFFEPLNTLRELLYEQHFVRAIRGAMGTAAAYSFIHAKFAEHLDEILDDDTDNWKNIRLVRRDRAAENPIDSSFHAARKRGFDDLEDSCVDFVTHKLKKVKVK